jgi:hypothetical protein
MPKKSEKSRVEGGRRGDTPGNFQRASTGQGGQALRGKRENSGQPKSLPGQGQPSGNLRGIRPQMPLGQIHPIVESAPLKW